jgi:chitin disaccharide deacetylase
MNAPVHERRIIVCADDFGANEPASNAIIELARRSAISATSCLVYAPAAATHASRLKAQAPAVSIGLHLDLTEFAPDSIRATLHRWLLTGFVLRNIDRAGALSEIRRQMQRFEDLFEAPPAYIDGHRHVHQIPGIREPLLQEMSDRYGRSVAIRSTCVCEHTGAKSRFIQELGGRATRALIARAGMHCNADFAGVYGFSTDRPFESRMENWLRHLRDGGMLMCHPELPRQLERPLNARAAEYRFFASPAWPRMLAAQNVRLQPFGVR